MSLILGNFKYDCYMALIEKLSLKWKKEKGFFQFFFYLRKAKLETKNMKTLEPILVEIVGQDICFSL